MISAGFPDGSTALAARRREAPLAIVRVLPESGMSSVNLPWRVAIVTSTRCCGCGMLLSPSDACSMNEPPAVLLVVGTKYQTPATRSTLPPVAPSRSIVTGSWLGSLTQSETEIGRGVFLIAGTDVHVILGGSLTTLTLIVARASCPGTPSVAITSNESLSTLFAALYVKSPRAASVTVTLEPGLPGWRADRPRERIAVGVDGLDAQDRGGVLGCL